jgi:hypothetical protein
MEWTIKRLEKDNIICITTSGPANWDQNKKMCEEAFSLAQKHGSHRFIVDHRKLEHGLTILQIDDIPGMLKQIGVTSQDKVAMVFDPASPISDAVKFFRDTAFLASLQLRIFSDKNKAITWLKASSPAKPKK